MSQDERRLSEPELSPAGQMQEDATISFMDLLLMVSKHGLAHFEKPQDGETPDDLMYRLILERNTCRAEASESDLLTAEYFGLLGYESLAARFDAQAQELAELLRVVAGLRENLCYCYVTFGLAREMPEWASPDAIAQSAERVDALIAQLAAQPAGEGTAPGLWPCSCGECDITGHVQVQHPVTGVFVSRPCPNAPQPAPSSATADGGDVCGACGGVGRNPLGVLPRTCFYCNGSGRTGGTG
jgi:hypothetical protein